MHSCSDVNCVVYVCVNTFWVEGVSHESTCFLSQKNTQTSTNLMSVLIHILHRLTQYTHVQMHAIRTQQYTYTIDANDARIHTHKHARTHTHKHTQTHTYTHIHTCTGTHARIQAHTHTCTHTRAHTQTHTLTHPHTHITYMHTHTHSHTHYVQPNTYIHKCTLTHIHTHADT